VDVERIASQVLGALLLAGFGAVGTWAVMRAQVADLRTRANEQDHEHQHLRERVTRLEERHDKLVDKLDRAIQNLDTVTGKLEGLALKFAGGK